MPNPHYAFPPGGLPPQTQRTVDRATFTTAYALIPRGVMRDIVTSNLPHWNKTRAWILTRPMSGFAETFAQYAVEVEPGGGSERPEPDARAEGVLFVADGEPTLTLDGKQHALRAGSYAFIPPGAQWALHNRANTPARFHWIRKAYEPADGIEAPPAFVSHDDDVPLDVMPDCNEAWATTRFVEPDDMRHDMHVNIVTFKPGGVIPFSETHVMEHGLYMLEGRGIYWLNHDFMETQKDDFIYMAPYCPQFYYATGWEKSAYLLYKDVNRDYTQFL